MENKIILSGKFSAAESLFKPRYQAQTFKLSLYQERLFQIATQGYQALTAEERANLSYNDRKIIEKSFGITRRVMNELKQTIMTNTISTLFGKLFPEARGNALPLLMMNVVDRTYTTRNDLKVSKTALIKRLVEEGVLPKEQFSKFAA